MLTEKQRAERNKEGVRKWYGENRDDYNALRRARYAADKETREKARDRATNYRGRQRAGLIAIERKLYREINGKKVEVFSTGQVAEAIGRTPQMLRNWEKADLIPPSTFADTHRLYTKRQVRMLVGLAKIIANYGGTWSSPQVKAKVRKIRQRW